MENLTGTLIQTGEQYWAVRDENTREILAMANTYQKAYGFITRAENAVNRPLPYTVVKVQTLK